MFQFLKHRNISTLYLYADSFKGRNILREDPDKYRALLGALRKHNIQVYALLGSAYLNTPEYVLPEKRSAAVEMFQAVLHYNAASPEEMRFTGVNIDIEPYLLDDWKTKRGTRSLQYLDLAEEFMRMKRTANATLSVGPAMPFWFDGIDDIEWRGVRKKLSEHTQDIYDYVAIMDYRNFAHGPDGIISHAKDEMEYADRIGKSVVIGIETLRTEPRKVTFYGLSHSVLEKELAIATADFKNHPSFAGYVIHHLSPYRELVGSPSQPQ